MKIKCVSNIDKYNEVSDYLTPGKVYDCARLCQYMAKTYGDNGQGVLLIYNGECAHGKWEVIEE